MGLYQGDKPLSAGKSPVAYAKDAGYAGTDTNFYTALADMPDHISDSENPHGTTASQVGAYTKDETNTLLQKKADSSSVYTKSESISAETRTALSLAETATPDAALAEIARQLSESGGVQLVKLWENAAPTSEFQAHSVTFDTSSSKAFIVSYKPHADAAYNFVMNAILVGKNNAVEMQSVIGSSGVHIGGIVIGVRKVTVTETGATFDSAYFVSTADSFTAHTKFCIPTVIYGIE